MHSNNLKSLHGIEQFKSLVEFNASCNSIFDLSGLASLKTLEILNLSTNKISSIPKFVFLKMERLHSIDFSHNEIESLEAFRGIKSQIDTIVLKDNYI